MSFLSLSSLVHSSINPAVLCESFCVNCAAGAELRSWASYVTLWQTGGPAWLAGTRGTLKVENNGSRVRARCGDAATLGVFNGITFVCLAIAEQNTYKPAFYFVHKSKECRLRSLWGTEWWCTKDVCNSISAPWNRRRKVLGVFPSWSWVEYGFSHWRPNSSLVS